MKKEYIIWGKAPLATDESILFTKAKTVEESKKVMKILFHEHNCTDLRLQVIDFSKSGTAFTNNPKDLLNF